MTDLSLGLQADEPASDLISQSTSASPNENEPSGSAICPVDPQSSADPAQPLAPTSGEQGGEEGEVAPAEVPAFPLLPPSSIPSPGEGTPVAPDQQGDDIYRPAPVSNAVLDALIAGGRHLYRAGGAEHRVTCPWHADHLPGEPTEAFYFEPNDDAPFGTFYCPCPKHASKRIGALLAHLKIDRATASGKPTIRLRPGEMHRVVKRAEEVLAQRGGFYRFNGLIVSVKTDAATNDLTTEPVSEQTLAMHLSAACGWEKWNVKAEEWRRCDVPSEVVNKLHRSQPQGILPELTALVRQPYLRSGTGELVTKPGYDAQSGALATFDPAQFSVPLLTKENAQNALRRLKSLLVEFEFADSTDRAATISAMLTATIRSYLIVAPGFNITASSPGSGKSYLASVIAPFAGPGDARNISYPATQEEATKVVLSLALEQPAAVCFDDMPTDWLPHGAMNRMLTSGKITERKLGSNTVVTARAASFIMGTGNNIRPLRDMARRVASIYLLPKVETAATRSYEGRPADEVRRNRGRYVSDALTIIAAWRAAGSPRADVPNIAGFEEWSNLCRHSLIWLGENDPATSLIEQIAHDPDREQLGNLLAAWRDVFGQRATLVRQVLKSIDNDKLGDLHDAVMELPCVERGIVNQSRFGRYLARNKNRIVNGLQLVEAPHSERRAWGVIPVARQSEQAPPAALADPLEGVERVWLDGMLAKGKTPRAMNSPA